MRRLVGDPRRGAVKEIKRGAGIHRECDVARDALEARRRKVLEAAGESREAAELGGHLRREIGRRGDGTDVLQRPVSRETREDRGVETAPATADLGKREIRDVVRAGALRHSGSTRAATRFALLYQRSNSLPARRVHFLPVPKAVRA